MVRALRGWYEDATFRYKYRTGHGDPWTTTNGFPQGCALSCIIMNALVATWLTMLKAAVLSEGVALHLASYADDQKITLTAPRNRGRELLAALQQVAGLSVVIRSTMGQSVSFGSPTRTWSQGWRGPL